MDDSYSFFLSTFGEDGTPRTLAGTVHPLPDDCLRVVIRPPDRAPCALDLPAHLTIHELHRRILARLAA